LLAIREMIFAIAAASPQIGTITETLKWGQPAYLASTPKSGTTIRLWAVGDSQVAIYTHCRTGVMSDFDQQFAGQFTVLGTRGLRLPVNQTLPRKPLQFLIHRALTYHVRASSVTV